MDQLLRARIAKIGPSLSVLRLSMLRPSTIQLTERRADVTVLE